VTGGRYGAAVPTILRNALVILALLLLGLAALAWFGDDPRTLPYEYEGHAPR
jgi:hypothetical protein